LGKTPQNDAIFACFQKMFACGKLFCYFLDTVPLVKTASRIKVHFYVEHKYSKTFRPAAGFFTYFYLVKGPPHHDPALTLIEPP